MGAILKILGPRVLQALLAMVNPNSRTFYLGIFNWIATYVVSHWPAASNALGLSHDGIVLWLGGTGLILGNQLLAKIVHGLFPALTWGTLSPPVATMPVEPGTPVQATVAATPKLAEKANENVATSTAKR